MSQIGMPNNIEASESGRIRGEVLYDIWELTLGVEYPREFKPVDVYCQVQANGEEIELLAKYCNSGRAVFLDGNTQVWNNACLTKHYTLSEKNGGVYYVYEDRMDSLPELGNTHKIRKDESGYLTLEELGKIRRLLGDMVEVCEREDTIAPIVAFLESQEVLIASAASELEDKIAGIVGENYSYLEGLYHHLHEHPELAHEEWNTSALLADELGSLGFEVTTGFAGFGVVAVLKNGSGPTALIRAEMDALPVQEETGLPYQSLTPNVMHACGHDMHMALLLSTAQVLTKIKEQWHGTLVLVGQPAEETGDGAKAMIDKGLFELFPRPDYALAVHLSASKPAGTLTFKKGYSLANVDYVDVTFKGPGGHGAMPDVVVNPINLASQFILDLNTFVNGVRKSGPAVLSVGSFHGGSEGNIIPKEVHLQMTSRSYSEEVRQTLEDGVKRIAYGVADGARAPRPIVEYRKGVPSLYNSPELVDELVQVFRNIVGEDNVFETRPKMYGDDFGFYGYETGIPTIQFGLGVQPADEDPKSWPQAHSPRFAPQFAGAFEIGALAMIQSIIRLQSIVKPTHSPLAECF